jgi:hypothetical protein
MIVDANDATTIQPRGLPVYTVGGLSVLCCARYVILHQESLQGSAINWTVAFRPQGHSWSGLSQVDACGAALTYIERVMRKRGRHAYDGAPSTYAM